MLGPIGGSEQVAHDWIPLWQRARHGYGPRALQTQSSERPEKRLRDSATGRKEVIPRLYRELEVCVWPEREGKTKMEAGIFFKNKEEETHKPV